MFVLIQVILVTGTKDKLRNEMRILAKNSADKYVFSFL